jgi:hypothetical protein
VGTVLTLAAAAVQVSGASLRVVVPFDHNGLFHIVQILAITVIARGVRQGLAAGAT